MRDQQTVTKDLLRAELLELKAELRGEIAGLHSEMQKSFIEVYRDLGSLTKTLWITQLSAIGIILVGVGLIVHFKI